MNALVDKSVIGQIESSYGKKNEILRYDFIQNKTFSAHTSLSSPTVRVSYFYTVSLYYAFCCRE